MYRLAQCPGGCGLCVELSWQALDRPVVRRAWFPVASSVDAAAPVRWDSGLRSFVASGLPLELKGGPDAECCHLSEVDLPCPRYVGRKQVKYSCGSWRIFIYGEWRVLTERDDE